MHLGQKVLWYEHKAGILIRKRDVALLVSIVEYLVFKAYISTTLDQQPGHIQVSIFGSKKQSSPLGGLHNREKNT